MTRSGLFRHVIVVNIGGHLCTFLQYEEFTPANLNLKRCFPEEVAVVPTP